MLSRTTVHQSSVLFALRCARRNIFACSVQEKPTTAEIRKDRPQGQAGKEVHGVRLGAKDRSYLVRDKQIEVLKNTYGGVKVNTRSDGHVLMLILANQADCC